MFILNRIVLLFLRGYKRLISPLLPPVCRFTPSCSEYAMECFKTHGFIMAFWLSAYRILRCNPLSNGGYDPVPQSSSSKGKLNGK
jgi:putative membrane protein insertion efficiency factor